MRDIPAASPLASRHSNTARMARTSSRSTMTARPWGISRTQTKIGARSHMTPIRRGRQWSLAGQAASLYGINGFGQMAGGYANKAGNAEYFVYDNGNFTSVGNPCGQKGTTEGVAGINNDGFLVGSCLWERASYTTTLQIPRRQWPTQTQPRQGHLSPAAPASRGSTTPARSWDITSIVPA